MRDSEDGDTKQTGSLEKKQKADHHNRTNERTINGITA